MNNQNSFKKDPLNVHEHCIRVMPYTEEWVENFNEIKNYISNDSPSIPFTIEHIGSTSIPNLPSKPVIDIDLIIENRLDFPMIKKHLEKLDYDYIGDLGISGREMFKYNGDLSFQKHHLYVCLDGILAVKNHMLFKEYLINHPEDVKAYGQLKLALAEKYNHLSYGDAIDMYCNEKTEFIADILHKAGLDDISINKIITMNDLD